MTIRIESQVSRVFLYNILCNSSESCQESCGLYNHDNTDMLHLQIEVGREYFRRRGVGFAPSAERNPDQDK